jgi:hypothetical protein
MPMRRTRLGPRHILPSVPWLRWLRAWRDDHEQQAASRAEARAHAPLHPGERLLAVARGVGGELFAATDLALYHQIGRDWTRLGWDEVGRIDWYEQRHVLVLTGVTPAVAARTVLRLAKDWDLPAFAAERVSWANLFDQRISLDRDAGARVIARRTPGEPHVKWLVVLDPGLIPQIPASGPNSSPRSLNCGR